MTQLSATNAPYEDEEVSVMEPLRGVCVAMITMGCAKNEVDSERMRAAIEGAGGIIVDDASASDAIIVNTCSFIQSATEESIEMIFDALSLGVGDKAAIPVIVAGCMPARYGDELATELGEASAFVPCSKEDDIAAVLEDVLRERPRDVDGEPIAEAALALEADPPADERPFAYVKISDGCDRWCSYCTIPLIRGRYHSFPLARIEADVDRAIASGKREIVFIAQDTGRWGSDLEGGGDLAGLLSHFADAHPDVWFRVMYVQPEGITDDLLAVMASRDNVCSYLDIPLQHVEPHILKAMNRSGSRREFEALIERIRDAVPDVVLRTTLIAGFPGETEEDIASLLDFVEEGHFDYVGVFPYSREEGTRAAEMAEQIPEDEKLFRAARIRDVADAVSASNVAARIGKRTCVLIEGAEADGQLVGRTQSQAPEVDGVTFIDGGSVGDIHDAEIVDTLFYDMEAEAR